ncbi:MAG: aldehyde dehydrogenase family protein [Acidimicrobiales bacterium]
MTSLLDSVSTGRPPEFGLFVGGAPRSGHGPELSLTSRLDSSVIGQVASADPSDVEQAYERLAAAQPAWRDLAPGARAQIFLNAARLFRERAGELGSVISAEMGKPLGEAKTEVEKGSAILEYFAQAPYHTSGGTFVTDTGEDVSILVEPLGVVALITPWNFPFTLPLRKIAAALATGNTALYKPASNGALCGLAIGQTLVDAGLPPDVLNVIVGKSSVIEHALFQDPRLGGVSLTGSYATAAAIRKVLPVEVPFQAELGGKNALVVWADADLHFATDIIWQSSFRNNGQICTSAGRLLVHADIADALLDRLRSRAGAQPSSTADGEFGILSSPGEQEKILETISRAAGDAVEIIAPDWGEGRVGPTVLVAPTEEDLLCEEIFGPVLTFETVTDIDEAVELANRTDYGLTAGIVTNDLDAAKTFWRGSHAGTVKVNASLTGTPFHVPLQGWGHSGVGAGEGGNASIDFFTRRKAVYLRRAPVR